MNEIVFVLKKNGYDVSKAEEIYKSEKIYLKNKNNVTDWTVMKTLGQLQVGDTFYLIDYDDSKHISNVHEKVVSIITDVAIGKIIKYLDAEGNIHGVTVTVTEDEFESTDASAYYLQKICSDKERCLELLREDKKSFLDNYYRIINQLDL